MTISRTPIARWRSALRDPRAKDAAISEVAVDLDGVEIERQIVEGGATEVLLGVAARGDLLVVGSRGRGGFASLLLGSIRLQCVQHASCPVVVVHPAKPSAGEHLPASGALPTTEEAPR